MVQKNVLACFFSVLGNFGVILTDFHSQAHIFLNDGQPVRDYPVIQTQKF